MCRLYQFWKQFTGQGRRAARKGGRTVSSLINPSFYQILGSHAPIPYRHKVREYPTVTQLLKTSDGNSGRDTRGSLQGGFRIDKSSIFQSAVQFLPRQQLERELSREKGRYSVNHGVELSYVAKLFNTQAIGLLLDGSRTRRGPVPWEQLLKYWDSKNHNIPTDFAPPVPVFRGGSGSLGLNINTRLMEILGSRSNRVPLLIVQREINEAKGRFFDGRPLRKRAKKGGDAMLAAVRDVRVLIFLVQSYLAHPQVSRRVHLTRLRIIEEARRIDRISLMEGFYENTVEFDNLYWRHYATLAREQVRNALRVAMAETEKTKPEGCMDEGRRERMRDEVEYYMSQLCFIRGYEGV